MSDEAGNEAQAAADAEAKKAADAKANDSQAQTFPLSYVQELRTEAATHRTKAATLETKLTTANTAHEAAIKAANEQVEAALALAKTASITAAVTSGAARLGFVDPDDAAKLMDASKVTFEDNKVGGVDDALKELATAKPHLLGSRAAGDGPDKPGAKKPSDMNAAIRKAAGVTAT